MGSSYKAQEAQLSALWDECGRGRDVQEGGDIRICKADSFDRTAETNTTL